MFIGVQQNVSIVIHNHNHNKKDIFQSSNFVRFFDSTKERDDLLTALLKYQEESYRKSFFIKVGTANLKAVFDKLFRKEQSFKIFDHTE